MTNFDEMIKKELAKEASDIDELLASDGGLPDLVAASFKGSMRKWVWMIWGITFAISILMFWCGYKFFIAETFENQVFWGFCTTIIAMAQIALKQWTWIEMSRASMMREIKRLELAVSALSRRGS
ncbi:MAG: hypothetical protein HWE25_01140 [Alphaproteobacteria bacterium]|nr:hypothetical protein [Alphaproteobacteria bacterium]